MAGTNIGGKNAAATNKARYGADFYKNIGAKGGAKGHTGGFYSDPMRARIAGSKGGQARRGCGPNQQLIRSLAIGESKEIPIPSNVLAKHFPMKFYDSAKRIGAKVTISSRMGNLIITRLG